MSAEISTHVGIINMRLGEVASLNQSIMEMEVNETSRANDLQDRRDIAVRDLSKLIDTQVYKDEHGQMTVRGPGGVLLVEGPRAASFEMSQNSDKGLYPRLILRDAFKQSTRDVTDIVKQGRLAGLIKVRDVHANGLRDNVNQFATSLSDGFNAIHSKGYGLGEYATMKGRDFFEGESELGEPAHVLRVSTLIQNDPDAIGAAMTPNAPGDNVIGNALVKLFYEPLVGSTGLSLSQHYDDFVGRLGIEVMHAREQSKASDIVVTQIEAQRESGSGVSLDEEAAALLKYQHLFTASSRIITTADEMFRTVLDLKR